MRVYDFDGTIYDGDSTRDFIVFCLKRHPRGLSLVPGAICSLILYAIGKTTRDDAKQRCLKVLLCVDDIEAEVSSFWDVHMSKVMGWYLTQRRAEDLVITASPAFIVSEACVRLGIQKPIATEVNPATMAMDSINCRGKEKVRRLRLEYPSAHIDEFYSDSTSDLPMALEAECAFFVRGDFVSPWKIESWQE